MTSNSSGDARLSVLNDGDTRGVSLFDLFGVLAEHWRVIAGGALIAGLIGLAIASLWPPTYTARTTLLPPQQQQSSTAAALSNLGALAGLAGGSGGLKSPIDQYISLMQSVLVSDHVINQFNLMEVYGAKYRAHAYEDLTKNVRISAGKKDGIITIEVDDRNPERSAAMANSYVAELRQLTNTLVISEAQQRRMFFAKQLEETRESLAKAQASLQSSGFTAGALKAEPRAAAEGYAKLRAETTAAQVKLQTLRSMLAESAPEIVQQLNMLEALRRQLAAMELATPLSDGANYIGRYRDFKYQEALLELFARQYELARIDESREGGIVQVIDVATAPELKSKPKRILVAAAASGISGVILCIFVLVRRFRK